MTTRLPGADRAITSSVFFNFVRQEVHDIVVGVHVVTAGRENVGAVVSPLELTLKKRSADP